MGNTLIDNSSIELSMCQTLKTCLTDKEITTVKIATGYWDLPGMALIIDELRQFLERNDTKLQLLIGKDPNVFINLQKQPKYKGSNFPDDFIKTDIHTLELKEEFQQVVDLLLNYCDDTEQSKIEIHIFRKNEQDETQFLHSKCYIFNGKNEAFGIIGSSNFTQKGLEGNAELNYLEATSHIVKFGVSGNIKGHIGWFAEKWKLSQPWNGVFLEQILKLSPIGKEALKKQKEISPYDLYIKYLQTQFGDMVNESLDGVLKSYLPRAYDSYQYQLDAVKQCFSIMKTYGGFMLADVVGLGKTVVGLLLVKRFIEESHQLGREANVLIVTPPAIKTAWVNTIADFDKDKKNTIAEKIDFITTGSIGNLMDEDDDIDEDGDTFDSDFTAYNYGLIIVDESHNFRNSTTQKYKDLNTLIDNITLNKGVEPYIGLLSATPQNNAPQDLKNQIYLFQREPDHSNISGITDGKLDSFFTKMQRIYDSNKSISNSEQGKKELKRVSDEIREKVLNYILVRRTRTDIIKHYPTDNNSLHFPDVKGPKRLEYQMDNEMAQLFSDTIDAINPTNIVSKDNSLGYFRYCAIQYFVDKENTKLYEKRNLTVDTITARLQKIMKILLVKRLESSKTAFKASLNNLRHYTQNMIDMIDNDCVFICPDIDVNNEFKKVEYKFEIAKKAILEKIEKKKQDGKINNRQFRKADFDKKYYNLLKEDIRIIDYLYERWTQNEDDPKMERFVEAIDRELFDTEMNTSQKIVIFTEAVDTLDILAKKVGKKHRVLKISAANRDKLQNTIRENFDANIKIDVQRNDYDVLITTEVLAEGVNLHRANVILNYDTPWNATRLMQRIGRVNRLGSTEKEVHVFNFFPSTEGNSQIHLVENAYAKIQAFHTLFGEDNKVFTEMEEIPEHEFRDLIYGAESQTGCFIKELTDYKNNNKEHFEQIKALTFENLGGKRDSADEHLVVVATERHGLSNVAINQENVARIISSLEMMQKLKCEPAEKFATITNKEQKQIYDLAMQCYWTNATRSINSKQASENKKKALEIIHNLQADRTLSKDSKSLLKQAQIAVKGGNGTIIRMLLKFDNACHQGEISLFGTDFEINLWISSAFGHLAAQTQQQHGKASVAIFEYKN
ncbi:MAG: helicase-related protein [Paludibacteraceae bacterium]|nr:helicase-related protein [Paludibacteraceae bacterium]